ncbi:cytochrome-c oxidase, cbb3-type subunit III [Vibrio sp. 10N.286.49.C2]|uniref:cytochrome-c oxidase, cbb3-type subunit III n=1 Tax=unclassified Vibrio TaxID=2614977 RepID=UPI000C83C9D5|nr:MULTISPECIES: cytochrome-c oxidase, cbb3-type subunit III [unclassified Vibrio]PMH42776.1 cytochrome-c oxidase, cbb3-type subunit III [Vibrio sp. 10N.286.49.C2]PMH53886.1 cytochrome-c oxidase, cbb3-type subunit III [Vibrio sp. 10N.286.49.B1]PMH79479.1 cytochrome-c oxidase, cbb3-type subunit III [Vibrio sp. 10N.286.48.B7]
MSNFWLGWASFFTILFLLIMIAVVVSPYRRNKQADKNKTLMTFDGVKENDAPIPGIVFFGYLTFFIGAFVYLLLFPGIASWKGVLNWTGENDSVNGHIKNPDHEIAQLLATPTNTPLTVLAKNRDLTNAGESLFKDNCAACHTESAEGQYNYPNLIDKDWLYGGNDQHIVSSITHGRHGMMPAWSPQLTDPQISELTDYVMNINNAKEPNALFTDNCSACHGPDGKGNQAIGAANLTDDVWLHGGTKQEIHHSIATGFNNQMPAFDARFSDNQILLVGAYLRSIQTDYKVEPSAPLSQTADTNSLSKIPAAAESCIACHGKNGEGQGDVAPKLAGLSAHYIQNQLHNFQSGLRQNATMKSMVVRLDKKSIEDVSQYYAKQTSPHSKISPRGAQVIYNDPAARLVNQGDWQRQIPSCVTCHGTDTLGVDNFPRLAGQNAAYLENQLLDWQQNKRTGDHDNMMKNIAVKLSSDEIKAVANYLSKMK